MEDDNKASSLYTAKNLKKKHKAKQLRWFETVQWKACVETPSWWRTLVGEDDEEDLRASANGPPMWWWLWLVPPPLHQLMFCWSLPMLLLLASSSLPVDSFRETSEEEFPGIEMERQVAEIMGLELLSASERGQSSKKCLKMWPPSDPLLPNPLWDSYGLLLLLLSCFISEQLLSNHKAKYCQQIFHN